MLWRYQDQDPAADSADVKTREHKLYLLAVLLLLVIVLVVWLLSVHP